MRNTNLARQWAANSRMHYVQCNTKLNLVVHYMCIPLNQQHRWVRAGPCYISNFHSTHTPSYAFACWTLSDLKCSIEQVTTYAASVEGWKEDDDIWWHLYNSSISFSSSSHVGSPKYGGNNFHKVLQPFLNWFSAILEQLLQSFWHSLKHRFVIHSAQVPNPTIMESRANSAHIFTKFW